eukprot:740016-Heterocapsa_arctica.AAC.1
MAALVVQQSQQSIGWTLNRRSLRLSVIATLVTATLGHCDQSIGWTLNRRSIRLTPVLPARLEASMLGCPFRDPR